MKIIPVYLPQYHVIPENDAWWGKGFTEWVNVRNAKPLFDGHNQPRVPLNHNYYDLSNVETLKWQCKLAHDHGVYGFCMYHYWFNGKLLLEKPMEMLLAHPEIDINYCISWANHDWTDGWKATNKAPKTLIAHDFNDEKDWVEHFNYMLPFFRDSRYMTLNEKPILVIYAPHLIPQLNKLLELWNQMAQKAGLKGLTYISQSAASVYNRHWDRSHIDYEVEMQPQYINYLTNVNAETVYPLLMKYSRRIKKFFGIKRSLAFNIKKTPRLKRISYDESWKNILAHHPISDKMIPCAFVDWDNTPRYREKGYLYDGVTPKKFEHYLSQLIQKAKKEYKTDMIFVFAWNEWAEGGYLEPDELNQYGFLEAIKRANI